MPTTTLTQHYLGLRPYALVEVEDGERAELNVGGIDTTDPVELRIVAKAMRASARDLRKYARRAARERRRAA